MTEDASEEQIGFFMQQLKNRHPENKKHIGRLFQFSSNQNTTSSQNRIIKVMGEVVSMMNPEVVRGLTMCSVNVKNLGKGVGGQYSSKRIEYNISPDKMSIMHEFIHHVHDSSTDETYDRLSDYFRSRTKTSIVQTLSLSRGCADHFAVSFNRYNDYAGTIYNRTERRVTDSKYGGPARKRQDNRNGVEMATTHLEKLQTKVPVFMRYWNDKQNGRYYWREAFMESMNLFFKK